MDDQDDISVEKNEPAIVTIPDHNNLDSYINQLRDCAIKIKNRELPPPKGQISGIIIAVILIVVFEAFLVDSEDSFFFGIFMATILVRICCTGRYTIAGFYEEAATALETYRDTGSIPEIGNAEECAEYVSAVTEACQNGLGDNTVRTPKQWLKTIR